MTDAVRVLYVSANGATGAGASALEDAGFSVVAARGGVDALKLLEDEPVGCLVAEIDLPDVDPVGFAHAVRSADSSLPVFFVGDPGGRERVDRLLGAGVTGHHETVDEALRARIRSAVTERMTDRELDRHRRLKDAVRGISVALADARTRDEVEGVLFRRLSAGELYRFVWVGDYDEASGMVSLARPVKDEIEAGELATVIGSEDPDVIADATGSGEIRVVDAAPDFRSASAVSATDAMPGPSLASAGGSRACIVLPLSYQGTVYDVVVLVSYRNGIDEAERRVLRELGAVAGHALWSIDEAGVMRERNERFVEQLVHELRNPLGVATTHLRIALEDEDEEALEQVEAALSEMDRAIAGVLTLVRRDDVEETAPGDLADDATEAWETITDENAELEIEDSVEFEADHDLVVRLLSNLFVNAIEHDGDGVEIRVGPLDDGFFVEDDGRGIDPERRETVFEWGYSTTESTGIGLTIVKTIADLHGWTIAATESEAGGARFEIRGVEVAPPPDEA